MPKLQSSETTELRHHCHAVNLFIHATLHFKKGREDEMG